MTSTFVNQDITFSGTELFMFEVFNINQLLITCDYNKVYGSNAEITKRLTQLFVHFLGEQIKTKDDIHIKNARLFIKFIYNCYVMFIVSNGCDQFNYIDNDILQKAIININKIIEYIDAINKYETINVNDIIEGYFFNKSLEDIIGFSLQTIEMSDEENIDADFEEVLSDEENDIEENDETLSKDEEDENDDDDKPLIEDEDEINNYDEEVVSEDEDKPTPIELELDNQ